MTESITADGGNEDRSADSDPERDEQGRFQGEFTDEEMLQFIREERAPAQTARSIADHFGVERTAAHRRLQRLADAGRVERAKLSPRVVIWWAADGDPRDQEAE